MPHLAFSHILRDLFLYILFPGIVMIVFLGLIVMLVVTIWGGNWRRGALRRAIGALLPLVVLVFVVAADTAKTQFWVARISSIRPAIQFLIGLAVGLVFMEIGKRLPRSTSVVAKSIFAMFVSASFAFLLWSVVVGILPYLHQLLLGFLVACGLHITFRGLKEGEQKIHSGPISS
jgi:hypothetical protein